MIKYLLTLLLGFVLSAYALADEKTVIKQVNAQNNTIKSFTADVQIVLQKRALTFTSVGKTYFEKPKNYRMQTIMEVRKAPGADMGSNDDYFWFWIRRIDPQTLYHSKYSNLNKTNLPDSLHPLWMMDLLGVNSIETKHAKLSTQSGSIIVQELQNNTRQQQIIKMVIVDPQRPAITGHRLYSTNGQLLASHHIASFFKTNSGAFLPQVAETKWYGEQITIRTTFSNPKINVSIDSKVFQMPKLNFKSVDIGKHRVEFDNLGGDLQ